MKIHSPAVPAKKSGRPTNERLMIELLDEIRRLLRSPSCTRCGAKGAKLGTPTLCETCRENG